MPSEGSIHLPLMIERPSSRTSSTPLLEAYNSSRSSSPAPVPHIPSPSPKPSSYLGWGIVAALCFSAGFLAHRVPPPADLLPTHLLNSTSSYIPSYLSDTFSSYSSHASSLLAGHRQHKAFLTKPPPSCRLCDSDPTNPLCDYGDSAIRTSRAYEGSGIRVRRFIEKALRGEEVVIGAIGASVTAGHGIGDHPTWLNRWFEGFQEQFPNSRLINGAAPAMTSSFYAYCFKTMIPEPADLYLVELDVNDDMSGETFTAQDALSRALLQQDHQPAVIKVSVFQIIFPDMIRGTMVSLLESQYMDVPMISIRNFLLPHMIAHPDIAPDYFTRFPEGHPDYRHISIWGHDAMGDMLTHYIHEQTCLTRQEHRRPRIQPKKNSPWPYEDVFTTVPRLHLWEKFSETYVVPHPSPVCNFASSTHRPLIALPSTHEDGEPWTRMEWNDKAALVSSTPGEIIRFDVEGTSAGVFVWMHPGNKNTRPELMPGKAACWIDGDVEKAVTINAYSIYTNAQPVYVKLSEELEPAKHIVSCQVLEHTDTTGHEFRIMGVVSL